MQCGLHLISREASPQRFSFANGEEDAPAHIIPAPYLPWRVVFNIRVLNDPGPILPSEDMHQYLGLVADHLTDYIYSKYLGFTRVADRLPSKHRASAGNRAA